MVVVIVVVLIVVIIIIIIIGLCHMVATHLPAGIHIQVVRIINHTWGNHN